MKPDASADQIPDELIERITSGISALNEAVRELYDRHGEQFQLSWWVNLREDEPPQTIMEIKKLWLRAR